jgi:hypothetical protein
MLWENDASQLGACQNETSQHAQAIGADIWAFTARAQGDRFHIHTRGASRHSSALLQAFRLALARVLRLALHVVIVVRLASGTDEEGCGHERGGGGANLLDLRDRVRKRSGVVELLLVEAVRIQVVRNGSHFGRAEWDRQGVSPLNWAIELLPEARRHTGGFGPTWWRLCVDLRRR